jgi:putative aldouronate transport system substrate-binding protein
MNLVLAGNEKVDLMITSPTSYLSTVATGGLQEIGPLLDKYGPDVKAALGAYLNGSKVNGKIYGVRPLGDLAGGVGLAIVKDVVDKYKIDLTVLKSYADIGKVLKIIKDNDPKAFPLTFSSQSDGMVQSDAQFIYDTLDDFFGVLPYASGDTKIINLFETQYYSDTVKLMRDWYQKGYVMKDAATAQEDNRALVKAGKAMCYITPTKPGIDVQETAGVGIPMYVQEYCLPTASTFVTTLFQWVVPNGAKTPEKSVQMLNLMYTDAALENLLAWGIEGKHYEKKADGTIGFPAGIDDKNSGYFINAPWMVGNAFLTKPWTGNTPDVWEKIKQMNQNAVISKAMGFSYDPTPVKTEVTAVSNAYEQYKKGLESGSVDANKILPQMLAKLKASGIDKVIAEKQKQFDVWLKANAK